MSAARRGTSGHVAQPTDSPSLAMAALDTPIAIAALPTEAVPRNGSGRIASIRPTSARAEAQEASDQLPYALPARPGVNRLEKL